jgi:tRNA G18 (ribose-2'-O)-methylase SpoU
LGACVRVAAAADVAGVLSTGTHDPLRSSSGRTGRCSPSTRTASHSIRSSFRPARSSPSAPSATASAPS